jgi:hypothetical protein
MMRGLAPKEGLMLPRNRRVEDTTQKDGLITGRKEGGEIGDIWMQLN